MRLFRGGRIDETSLIHLSPLFRMRRIMLAGAHRHAEEKAGSETQMKRRHNLPIVCAHSLRVNFMVTAAFSPNPFTTTGDRMNSAAAQTAQAGSGTT